MYLLGRGIGEPSSHFVCIIVRISRSLGDFIASSELDIRVQQVMTDAMATSVYTWSNLQWYRLD